MQKLNRIKEVMQAQGRTQSWLASKMYVTRNAINAMCNNRSQPSLKKLYEIANLLEVDAKELLVSNLEDSE